MTEDDVIAAASRLDAAVFEMGDAYRALDSMLGQARLTALRDAGETAMQGLTARAGSDRLATETAGAMVTAGLATLFHAAARVHAVDGVPDLAARWHARARDLVAKRVRKTATPIPGQSSADQAAIRARANTRHG